MIDIVFEHVEQQRQGEFTPYRPELTDDGKDVQLIPYTIGDTVIRSLYFPLPRPSLIRDYEKKRKEHNMEQLNELQDSLKPKSETDGRGKNPNSLKNLRPFRAQSTEERIKEMWTSRLYKTPEELAEAGGFPTYITKKIISKMEGEK